MTAPVFRRDPIGGWWTIVAPGRDGRPVDRALASPPAESDPSCPFCPGNESELEEIVEEIDGPEGWVARAVLNRWPFLSAEPGPEPEGARGRQEVLVESRRHVSGFAGMTGAERRNAVELWWRRATRVAPEYRPVLFRNEGRGAGATRLHPHAQLAHLADPPGVSSALRERLVSAGHCLPCEAAEAAGEALTVLRTRHYALITLDAPLDPFHARVVPLRHVSTFRATDPDERTDLAAVVGAYASALRSAAHDPAWNLIVHDLGTEPGAALHWHVELRPRFARTAGFELSTGYGVCGVAPEDAAARLRDHLPNHISDTP